MLDQRGQKGESMDEHGKKMIAPVVVVLCLVAYYASGVLILIKLTVPVPVKVIAAAAALAISAAFIAVLVERIREIKKGEEDDLGNY